MNTKRSLTFAFLALVLAVAATDRVFGQTTLAAGDIAFTGYTSQNTPDEFSFVLLKSVAAGTTINFTDNSWLNTSIFRAGEQNVTWTASTALPAGTEIYVSGLTANTGTMTGSAGGLSLSTSGDQVLAFQGTIASPTFISGIHMNVYVIANGDPVDTTAAAWDGTNSNNTSASALPPGLTTGTNAIWVGTFQVPSSEFDNARFTCGSANISTPAAARAALNNPANWQKTNLTPVGFTLPTGCPYLVTTAAGISISGRAVTAKGTGIVGVTVTLTDSNGVTRSARTNSFGFYTFDDVEAGGTYFLSAANKRYAFQNPFQTVSVVDNLTTVDFIAY